MVVHGSGVRFVVICFVLFVFFIFCFVFFCVLCVFLCVLMLFCMFVWFFDVFPDGGPDPTPVDDHLKSPDKHKHKPEGALQPCFTGGSKKQL